MPAAHHSLPKVTISAKAAKSIGRRHPWIFSGAVVKADRDIAPGATVAVQTAEGRQLAVGAWSPRSQIRVRIWSFDDDAVIDRDFFQAQLRAAVAAREQMVLVSPCEALRLVHAESDELPGLIVDRYGDILVCQFLSAGAAHWKEAIVMALRDQMAARTIFERSDAEVRDKEGLPRQSGTLWGADPPERIEVTLGPMRMQVDVVHGHKTGFYLDQRENQARIAAYARNRRVLNCFCFTGGFGIRAALAGARSVTQLDASADVLHLAHANATLNGLDADRIEYVTANVFEQLRLYRDQGRQFDLIVLDPPKFVAAMGQMNRGCRAYKDINLLAFKLLAPGGVLMTFSCSGLVSPALFQKIVADAALDAGRRALVVETRQQAADHPVALAFPEGHYLKGLICLAH